MRLSVDYRTLYRYSQPARRVIQLLRLTPLSFEGQNVLDWRIDVDCDARLREGRDGYGNITHMLYIDQAIEALNVTVTGRLLTQDKAGVVAGLADGLPPEAFLRQTRLTEPGVELRVLATEMSEGIGSRLENLHRLTAHIHERMKFDTGGTEVDTSAADAFSSGHGVCQDFSHIFISAARAMGVPARYVSGHLFRRDGAIRQEAAHAWAEAWVDDLGWVAFDPSNGISADDAYIRIACGLDYRDAAPFAGSRSGGGSETLSVEVQVRQISGQNQSQTSSGLSQSQSQSQD